MRHHHANKGASVMCECMGVRRGCVCVYNRTHHTGTHHMSLRSFLMDRRGIETPSTMTGWLRFL